MLRQSNMEMPIKGWGKVMNFQQEINQANHPDIRLYQVKKTLVLSLLQKEKAQWEDGKTVHHKP